MARVTANTDVTFAKRARHIFRGKRVPPSGFGGPPPQGGPPGFGGRSHVLPNLAASQPCETPVRRRSTSRHGVTTFQRLPLETARLDDVLQQPR